MNNEQGVPTNRVSLGAENPAPSNVDFSNIQLPNFSLPPPITNNVRATPELLQLIRGMVSEAIGPGVANNELQDETITDRSNLTELDKIPDIVKGLKDFSGEPNEYSAWRKSVDRVMDLYGHLRGSSKYYGILSTVRNKIAGQANTVLESYNTPLNWQAIKQCLSTHFADKRDISTLEYQLTTLVQGNNTIEEFYQKVYSHFSLILNNVSNMGLEKATEAILIESYRNKTLDTFIRGLNGDLPRLLAIREPTDLAEALHICTKLANQNFRTNYANNNNNYRTTYGNNNQGHFRPPLPQKNFRSNQNNQFNRQFFPDLTHFGNRNPTNWRNSYSNQNQGQFLVAQNFNRFPQQNQSPPNYQQGPYNSGFPTQMVQNNAPPRPNAQKPAEPMDVDRSLRSAMVNYANRPVAAQNNLGKRMSTMQQSNYAKQARQFHINDNECYNAEAFNMEDMNNALNEEYETTFSEYVNQYEEQDKEEQEEKNEIDVSEIHFLG